MWHAAADRTARAASTKGDITFNALRNTGRMKTSDALPVTCAHDAVRAKCECAGGTRRERWSDEGRERWSEKTRAAVQQRTAKTALLSAASCSHAPENRGDGISRPCRAVHSQKRSHAPEGGRPSPLLPARYCSLRAPARQQAAVAAWFSAGSLFGGRDTQLFAPARRDR